MKKSTQGDLLALLCAICVGTGISPAKIAVGTISSETLTFYLFVFAFFISLLPLFIKSQRRIIGSVTRDQLVLMSILAILFASAIFMSWKALEFLEPATQSFLSRIRILVIVIFAIILLREKLHWLEIIGGIIATSGLVLLKLNAGIDVSKGATLMLASAFLYATAEILLKRKINDIHPTLFLFYRNLTIIPCFALIIWLQGKSFVLPDYHTALMILLTALLGPILGRTLYILAIKRNSLSRTVLFGQTQPIFAAIAGYAFLRSVPTPIEWIGGGLIMVGALIISRAKIK